MLFKVKEDVRYGVVTACGGMEFTKKTVTNVPDRLVAEAEACLFLEKVEEEAKPEPKPEPKKPEPKKPEAKLSVDVQEGTEPEPESDVVEEDAKSKKKNKKEG